MPIVSMFIYLCVSVCVCVHINNVVVHCKCTITHVPCGVYVSPVLLRNIKVL